MTQKQFFTRQSKDLELDEGIESKLLDETAAGFQGMGTQSTHSRTSAHRSKRGS